MSLALPLRAAAVALIAAAFSAAAAGGDLHYGRMAGMTIEPTGKGLGISVVGRYFAGHVFTVNALVTLPDQNRAWYLVGSEHGIVSLTDTQPAPAWPPSDALPVLLATIAPVAARLIPNWSYGETHAGTAGPYTTSILFSPIRPGSVTIDEDGAAVATDDGHGNLAGAAIASGTVNYATGDFSLTFKSPQSPTNFLSIAYTYLPQAVHRSWLTLYPPVDNPAAQQRKADFDSGAYRIPGKDFPVGLPPGAAPEALTDLAAHPYGCDAAVGGNYVVSSSGHAYDRFRLIRRMMYFPPAGEGASLTVVDDGSGHVALNGFPTGIYFDPTRVAAQLSDGTPLGPGTGNCYGGLTSLQVPASTPFAGQTVSAVTGGGTHDNIVSHAFVDAGNNNFGIQDNTVGVGNQQAMPGQLTILDSTLTWSHPTNLGVGGSQGIAYSGPIRGRNLYIENFGACIAPTNHADFENVYLRHCGIGDGAHGAGFNIFGGFNQRTEGGFTGWSHVSHFNISMPAWDSPNFDGSETTALLAFETNGSVDAGVTNVEFADGLLDGGTYAVAINSTFAASNSPIRNIALHDLWVTPNYEFHGKSCGVDTGPVSFHQNGGGGKPAVFGPVLIWNIFDTDTGEVLADLTGSWSSDAKGCAIKSPLPAADFNGASIAAIRK